VTNRNGDAYSKAAEQTADSSWGGGANALEMPRNHGKPPAFPLLDIQRASAAVGARVFLNIILYEKHKFLKQKQGNVLTFLSGYGTMYTAKDDRAKCRLMSFVCAADRCIYAHP